MHIHSVKKRDLEFEVAVGQRVRQLRHQLGWSQKHLGDLANLEQNQIQRLEQAKNTTTLAIITAVAAALGRQPYDILKTEYQIKVNAVLDKPVKKKTPETTRILNELARSSFFNSPRSVIDIIQHCKKKYRMTLPSSASSAVLKKLVDADVLRRIPAKIKGRFLYQKK